MAAPPNRPQACPGGWIVNVNTVCGMITNVTAGAPNSIVTTNQFLEDFNQYENGLLRLGPQAAARRFKVLGNTVGVNAMVTVQNDNAGAPPNNVPFDLHDDDDDAILPRLPDLGWMQDSDNPNRNLFAWAYVRPINDGGGNVGNNQANLSFQSNVEFLIPPIIAQINAGKQATGTEDFWVSYVQAAFQNGVNHDNDPDGDVGFIFRVGWVGTIRGVTPVPGDAALIFVESYRDSCGGLGAAANRSGLQATVVHEIGHTFGAVDGEGGIMNTGCLIPNKFVDVTLNRIRSSRAPGKGTF